MLIYKHLLVIQVNLIITLSLGFMATDHVIRMKLFTIEIKQNNHFGSHDMAVLY